MEIRELREQDFEVWADFCSRNFDVPAAYFLRHYQNDPWADIHGVFTAWDGDTIVGSVRVLTREIYLKGQKVAVGGIGEVCTDPATRGKGVSTGLLRHAIAYMEAHKLPISMLFTGTQHHYAHLGWLTAPRRYVKWDVAEEHGAGTLNDTASLAAVSAVYDRYAPQVDGVLTRGAEYFERWVKGEEWDTAVWERDGRAVACAVYRKAESGAPLQLSDCVGETLADKGALLRALCERDGMDTKVYIAACCAPANTDFDEAYGTMVRLNAPFELNGVCIDTPSKLAAAMADATFFRVDSY